MPIPTLLRNQTSDNLLNERLSLNEDLGEKASKYKALIPAKELELYRDKVLASQTPLWTYWEHFVMDYLFEGRSEKTLSGVRDTLRFLIRNCEIYSVEKCNDIQTMHYTLRAKCLERLWTASTFNSYRKRLNTYFLWMESLNLIDLNNVKNLRTCKEPIKEQPTLSVTEAQQVLGYISTYGKNRMERSRNRLFVGIMLSTGIRPCEALQMKLNDIRPAQGHFTDYIRGRKQKGHIRQYAIDGWLKDVLEDYLNERVRIGRNEPQLFISLSKRTGWTEKGMRKFFKKMSVDLGFSVGAYCMRRYVATTLEREGASMEEIMKHLGHTRMSTTRGYIESSEKQTAHGISILSNLFPQR